jgi:hypothetical protein
LGKALVAGERISSAAVCALGLLESVGRIEILAIMGAWGLDPRDGIICLITVLESSWIV